MHGFRPYIRTTSRRIPTNPKQLEWKERVEQSILDEYLIFDYLMNEDFIQIFNHIRKLMKSRNMNYDVIGERSDSGDSQYFDFQTQLSYTTTYELLSLVNNVEDDIDPIWKDLSNFNSFLDSHLFKVHVEDFAKKIGNTSKIQDLFKKLANIPIIDNQTIPIKSPFNGQSPENEDSDYPDDIDNFNDEYQDHDFEDEFIQLI